MRFTATISVATCALAITTNGSLLGNLLGNINLQINACPQIYLDTSGSNGAKGRPVFQSSNPACPNYIPPEQLVAVDPSLVPGSDSSEIPDSKVSASSPVESNGSRSITMAGPMSTAIPKASSTATTTTRLQDSLSVKSVQSSAPATKSAAAQQTTPHKTGPTMATKPTTSSDGMIKPSYIANNAEWLIPSLVDPKAPAPAPAPAPSFSPSFASTSKGCTLSLPKPTDVEAVPGIPSYREMSAPPPFRGANTNDFAFPAIPVPDVKPLATSANAANSMVRPQWPMGVIMETRNVGAFEFSS
ncbi:hypothetical protein J3B02_001684 [Coemansia erecta]|nr:hypothetical protein J3B02_001684 [Coemansia erecta]KAJ2883863.1 hypothetical protein FB639_002078 [Coemansia asiatica]